MKPTLPVDYAQHESVYKRLRERGADGWSDKTEYETMLSLVSPHLPAVQGSTPSVLELGSGAGNLSLALADAGYQVTGIEISPTGVEWSAARAAEIGSSARFSVDNVVGLTTCADQGSVAARTRW